MWKQTKNRMTTIANKETNVTWINSLILYLDNSDNSCFKITVNEQTFLSNFGEKKSISSQIKNIPEFHLFHEILIFFHPF